jgi:uncharacterized coiled-coil DUF342 family protein
MTDDLRSELDAYRAETRAARAEAAAFRSEIGAYRSEVVAWRETTETRFDRLDAELGTIGHVIDILHRRLQNVERRLDDEATE